MSDPIPPPSRSIVLRWVVPLVIIGAALGALLLAGFDAIRPAVAVRVAPVVPIEHHGAAPQVSPHEAPAPASASASSSASPRPAARWVQAPGWIEPEPQPVIVSALRDGIVEEVLALEGDAVARGAPVARLESQQAVLALAQAEAALARAQAERERYRALAAEARTEEAQLPFRRAAAQARFDAAKDAWERAERLIETSALGEAELVRLRNAMFEARAELEAIDPRARAIAAAIAAADAEAASATLIPEATLRQAELDLERCTVRSPIDGIVMEVHAMPGQNLIAGDMALGRAIVTLYDPRRLQVRADVPLADAAGLAVGRRARVTVEVLPERVFDGVVVRLVHKADIQKNTVQAKVSLLDPSPELKPDMLARVRIEVAPPPSAIEPPTATAGTGVGGGTASGRLLLARAEGLMGRGTERRALVITGVDRGRGRVEERRVQVLDAVESPRQGWLVTVEGLAVGDRIVLDPPSTLAPGAFVTIIEDLRDSSGGLHAAR